MSLTQSPEFWRLEADAPLLRRNNNFVTPENAESRSAEMRALLDLIPADFKSEVAGCCSAKLEKTGDAEMDRIFYQDAVRTFSDETHRQVEVRILNALYNQLKDYHQGLGFVVAFLSLFLAEADVVLMCLYMSRTSHEGYFKIHNDNYLRDARVFDELLLKKDPELGKHLQTYTVSGAFCSKWWIGMNLHCLPFEALFRWWQIFMRQKEKALFAFGLAVVERNRDFILKTSDTAKIMELLRFEHKVYDDNRRRASIHEDSVVDKETDGGYYLDMLERAAEIEVEPSDLSTLRESVQTQMEAEEEARRKHREAADDSDDEIVFSDED